MIKSIAKLIACVLTAVAALTYVSACAPQKSQETTNEPIWAYEKQNIVAGDSVYSYFPDGLDDVDQKIRIQSPAYSLQLNSKTGKLDKILPLAAQGAGYTPVEEEQMDDILDMKYTFENGSDRYVSSGRVLKSGLPRDTLYARLIEGGRYMQKIDVLRIGYNSEGQTSQPASNYFGRLEIAATLNYFALAYETYNGTDTDVTNAGQSMQITFAPEYNILHEYTANAFTLSSQSGKGFTFYIPNISGVTLSYSVEGNVVTFLSEGTDIPSSVSESAADPYYEGFSVLIRPSLAAQIGDATLFYDYGNIESEATQIAPNAGTVHQTSYDARRGVFVVNVDNMMKERDLKPESAAYDRLDFTFTNNNSYEITIPVEFEKKVSDTTSFNFPPVGYAPVIREAATGIPTGIQVQVSKQWHSFSSISTKVEPGNPSQLETRPWSRCYIMLTIPANSSVNYEYTVPYDKWGDNWAVSHAQLSIIGWGGNWTWDQSAIGSYGESVTYDPDMVLGRAMINDVRPFLMIDPTRSTNKWSWTGNVGGADFLVYHSYNNGLSTTRQAVNAMKIDYRSPGPNMTDTSYIALSEDRKIAMEINIKMGRTDDINRTYFTLKYYFLEDVSFDKLAFFKMSADDYAANKFTKYAYGDAEAIAYEGNVNTDDLTVPAGTLVEGQSGMDMKGSAPWFMQYDSALAENRGNVLSVVRQAEINANGKVFDYPTFSIMNTINNNCNQIGYEIVPPSELGNQIKRGSTFEYIVEYSILPAPSEKFNSTYYGFSDYLLASTDNFNTAKSALQQAFGNLITAEAIVGELSGTYPVTIISDNSSEIVAQFLMTGGLGYTPVVIQGLESYKTYRLQVKNGSTWQDIDQSISGNDFWQTRKMADGKYEIVYNVKNSTAADFRVTNEYRMIKE